MFLIKFSTCFNYFLILFLKENFMGKSLIIWNLDPLTTELEVRNEIGGPIPILSIQQITDFYKNQTIFFPLFLIKTTHSGMSEAFNKDRIFKIRGKVVEFSKVDEFLKNESGIILFGDTKHTTKNDVLHSLSSNSIKKVKLLSSSTETFFFITFKTKESAKNFLINKKCCKINSNIYYSHPFPILEHSSQENNSPLFSIQSKIFQEKTLKLIHMGKQYNVPFYVACASSSYIREILSKDPKAEEISIPDIEGPFDTIQLLFLGESINTEKNPKFYFMIGIFLGIDSLIEKTKQSYYNILTLQNIIECTKFSIKYGRGISIHLQYIKTHYSEVSALPEFASISDQLIKYSKEEEEKENFLSKEQFDFIISDTSIDLNTQREKLKRLIQNGL